MQFDWHKLTTASAQRKLMPKLRGRVFHRTSLPNFLNIIATGCISNNQNGEHKKNWASNSYFRNRGYVSVCDLHNNKSVRNTNNAALSNYQIFGHEWDGESAFLFLSSEHYDKLATWHQWEKEKAYSETIVPHLESGFPKKIPLAYISEIWLLKFTDYDPILKAKLDEIHAEAAAYAEEMARQVRLSGGGFN